MQDTQATIIMFTVIITDSYRSVEPIAAANSCQDTDRIYVLGHAWVGWDVDVK